MDILGVLKDILCACLHIGDYVLWGLMMAVNGLVIAVGSFIALVVSLMPALPAVPAAPSSAILGFVAYLFPIGGVVAALATFVALWGAFMLIRVPLRWAKVL
jgi:hypothetical protein